jgi:MFS family permease
LPLPLVLAVASPGFGSLAGRWGTRPFLIIGATIVAAGFLLMLRMGAPTHYWSEVLPALLVMALGLSCAVAPLTTAVFASVDRQHTGSASGLNNAIARTGGLVATALLGQVLAYQGALLISAFHWAVILSAGACLIAGACGLLVKTVGAAEGRDRPGTGRGS